MKIFLSAVSGQFKACRDALRSDLSAVGAEVVVQEDFQQHGASLLEKLERYIASCDRIIALVGDAYGFESEETARPAGQPRRSYTQWEYYFAMGERLDDGSRQPPKDIFLYIGSPEFLAVNRVSQGEDAAQLQQEFIKELLRSGKDRNQFGSLHELRALVLRDGFRLQTRAPGIFLPPEPEDFVGRAEALEKLYALVVEKQGRALLHGEPGSGKSTLALKIAWQTQGAFDAVVFQLCGQRSVAEIAGELARKLKLGLETRPPEEQIVAVKTWLVGRRALLVLDDIWENDVEALVPDPPVSLLCTSRRHALPWISPAHSMEVKSFSQGEVESIFRRYLDDETVEKHRDALLEFAKRVERLPIAIVVGADILRSELDPIPEAARGLRLERLRTEVHDVAALLRRAITARPEQQRRLLHAMSVCAIEGFWLPLTVEIAGLTEAEGRAARNKLVDASLLRMLDRDRQRFQLHALLREELRNFAPLGELQAAHAAALEGLFTDWEGRWRECRECLPEVIPAVQQLWEKGESSRAASLTYRGFATGRRIGELEIAFRIAKQEEALCLELGNKDSLQRSYGNQALILQAWGRLKEAFELLKKQEVLCLDLGNKDSLQRSYSGQALILKAWGRLEEAFELLKKQEALCLELDNKDSLQWSYGGQALILKAWGRLEEAFELLKKQEALCLELGNKDSLQISYGNQALILQAWGRLEEAFELLKKQEVLCLELGNKDILQRSYGGQALILKAWGRLKEAFELLKKQEVLCLELGNKDSLQRSYGNQALILKDWDRLEEAFGLLKKQEALCLELGNRIGLAYCYWNWALLAPEQRDSKTEREKLAAALDIFTKLNMQRERDAVRAELEKTTQLTEPPKNSAKAKGRRTNHHF